MITKIYKEVVRYVRSNLPLLPDRERTWTDEEFKKIERSMNSMISKIQEQDERIAALEDKAQ